jgi:hypothetical protein
LARQKVHLFKSGRRKVFPGGHTEKLTN